VTVGVPENGSASERAATVPTFTIESFARSLIHDPVHHLNDVGQERGPRACS
jgi:hypothetical protein